MKAGVDRVAANEVSLSNVVMLTDVVNTKLLAGWAGDSTVSPFSHQEQIATIGWRRVGRKQEGQSPKKLPPE
jgi:hypothetical protein